MVEIFTDGACSGNPGRGGYGVILRYNQHIKELSAGFRVTTNNRMELLATIAGLEALNKEGLDVTIISDSEYVINSVTKGWVFNWERKAYKDRANADLWKRFLISYRKHQVQFKWVRGHTGHPENERCDALAVAASRKKDLFVDEGFESEK
ncbi:MAG: ribonuclease HI [Cytophagales bacterium]